MSNSLYKLYEQDNLDLVKSLIVKSEQSARAMNRKLALIGQPVSQDPKEWIYYLNLNGTYHSTNEPMFVTSIDTLEQIPFNKESLDIHKTTAQEYKFNSQYYLDLLARYPEQELLIRGILDPIDIDVALAAPNYTILYHDKTLVEPNEELLMYQVQKWTTSYMERWDVGAYEGADELYVPAHIAGLCAHLPNVILTLRLEACKTRYAHSYHIWTYLAGKGKLNLYKDVLTVKQSLYLYRNIQSIIANAGKTETFDKLVENLLTERGFPVFSLDIEQRTQNLLENLYPDVVVNRNQINETTFVASSKFIRPIDYIFEKTLQLGTDNEETLGDHKKEIELKAKANIRDTFKTNVFEGLASDASENKELTLTQVLIESWVAHAVDKHYVGNIQLRNPVTGGVLQLNPKDAFILYLYCLNKSVGVTLDQIPNVPVSKVLRYYTGNDIAWTTAWESGVPFNDKLWVPSVKVAMQNVPNTVKIINRTDFFTMASTSFNVLKALDDTFANWPSNEGRNYIRGIYNLSTQRKVLDLGEGLDYRTWFAKKELDLSALTRLEYGSLALTVFEGSTGLIDKNLKPSEILAKLSEIMNKLCSYDVSFVSTVENPNALEYDCVPVRTSVPAIKAKTYAPEIDTINNDFALGSKSSFELEDGQTKLNTVLLSHTGAKLEYKLTANHESFVRNKITTHANRDSVQYLIEDN